VADYFYRLGGSNYDKAEENYQKVYLNANWPQSELSFQARMMAGRAASARYGYKDAANYFRNLITELTKLSPPSALLPEAYFALADTYVRDPEAVPGSTNTLDNYNEAIVALAKIPREFPTNALAPLAWGQMGAYYSQLAGLTHDATYYARAGNAYNAAITNGLADATCRGIAEVGLAEALEKQAELAVAPNVRTSLLREAMEHYLAVVYGRGLREHEVADPFWVKKAALGAARLAEEQQQWTIAAGLYQNLLELAPTLRKTWELKLERLGQLQAQIQSVKN